ncbi:uncharacterized protein LOC134929572 [Pseudophryne corroboree]|uniref:uncharacterized protein LOC134929572 n=1 Tax=Pseudophryne corroboree TaxID=495146 RepID=UPI00308162A4
MSSTVSVYDSVTIERMVEDYMRDNIHVGTPDSPSGKQSHNMSEGNSVPMSDVPTHAGDTNHSNLPYYEKTKHNEDSEKSEKRETTKQMVGFLELWRYADALDIFLMIFGLICAAASGTGQSILINIFGHMAGSFVSRGSNMEDD